MTYESVSKFPTVILLALVAGGCDALLGIEELPESNGSAGAPRDPASDPRGSTPDLIVPSDGEPVLILDAPSSEGGEATGITASEPGKAGTQSAGSSAMTSSTSSTSTSASSSNPAELPLVECGAGVCANGGTCSNAAGGAACCCPPGWTGLQCEGVARWELFDLRNGLWGNTTVGLIVHDVVNPEVLYVSDSTNTTGDRVRKSEDRGLNWQELCGDESYGARAIALVPNANGTAYLAPGAGYGLLKLPGLGAACRNIELGGYGYYTSVVVDGRNAAVVLAGSKRLATNTPGIYRSEDAGATWRQVNTELSVEQILLDPDTDAILAVGMRDWGTFGSPDLATAGVWRSSDDGKVWNQILSNRGAVTAFVLKEGRLVAATERSGVIVSDDLGAQWLPTSGLEGVSVKTMTFDPSDDAVVYAGTIDNGIYLSRDAGATWAPFSEGLEFATTHAIAVDPADPHVLYAGVEDRGLFRRKLPGADGACALVLPGGGDDPWCLDTCTFAEDGQCDDGGSNSDFDGCEFGTDCVDCGSRAVQ